MFTIKVAYLLASNECDNIFIMWVIVPIKMYITCFSIGFFGQLDERKKMNRDGHKKNSKKKNQLGVDRFYWIVSCSTQFIITFSPYHHKESLTLCRQKKKTFLKIYEGLLVESHFNSNHFFWQFLCIDLLFIVQCLLEMRQNFHL